LLRLALRVAMFALRILRKAVDQPLLRFNKWRERRTAARVARPPEDGRGLAATWGALATA